MQVFSVLNLVKYLDPGIPRILKVYDENSFIIIDKYTHVVFSVNEDIALGSGPTIGQKNYDIDLIKRQIELIEIINKTSKISRKELSEY